MLISSQTQFLELGPGDSLGVGIMSVLTGAQKYIVIDAVRHTDKEKNLEMFDKLLELLKERSKSFW